MAMQQFCYAQDTQIKYYNSKYKEVPENKARYVEVRKKNDDGSVTTQTTDLKRGQVIRSETYKGEEPYGIWIGESWTASKGTEFQQLDYNFPLVYSTDKCSGQSSDVKQILKDSLDYIAPKIAGGIDFYTFLGKNIQYPALAKENGIQGRVYLMFSVTSSGNVANVVITKGAHIVLDKEAARVIRKIKFDTPPMSAGKSIDICIMTPIVFRME